MKMKNPSLQALMSHLTREEEDQVLEAVSELLLQSKLFEWMRHTLVEAYDFKYQDFFIDGIDVNLTFLAEEAIRESGLVPEDQQLDAIEDETHQAWNAAVDAADWWAQEKPYD